MTTLSRRTVAAYVVVMMSAACVAGLVGYWVGGLAARTAQPRPSTESGQASVIASAPDAGVGAAVKVPWLDLPPIDPKDYPPRCAAYVNELMMLAACRPSEPGDSIWLRYLQVERPVPYRIRKWGDRAGEDRRCDEALMGIHVYEERCDPGFHVPVPDGGTTMPPSSRDTHSVFVPSKCVDYIDGYNKIAACKGLDQPDRERYALTASWMKRSYARAPDASDISSLEAECELGLQQLVEADFGECYSRDPTSGVLRPNSATSQVSSGSVPRDGGINDRARVPIRDAAPTQDASILYVPAKCAAYVDTFERVSKCKLLNEETRNGLSRAWQNMKGMYRRSPGASDIVSLEAGCQSGLEVLLRAHPGC